MRHLLIHAKFNHLVVVSIAALLLVGIYVATRDSADSKHPPDDVTQSEPGYPPEKLQLVNHVTPISMQFEPPPSGSSDGATDSLLHAVNGQRQSSPVESISRENTTTIRSYHDTVGNGATSVELVPAYRNDNTLDENPDLVRLPPVNEPTPTDRSSEFSVPTPSFSAPLGLDRSPTEKFDTGSFDADARQKHNDRVEIDPATNDTDATFEHVDSAGSSFSPTFEKNPSQIEASPQRDSQYVLDHVEPVASDTPTWNATEDDLSLPEEVDHGFRIDSEPQQETSNTTEFEDTRTFEKAPGFESAPVLKNESRQPTTETASRAMIIVTQRADEIVQHAFSLASRNATFSARSEYIFALRTIAEALDAHEGHQRHSQSLDAGLLAIREADEFISKNADVGINVEKIAEAHSTPVLQGSSAEKISPLIARQKYYTFAQTKLAEACGENRAGSRALYGLGKLHSSRITRSNDTLMLSGPKAVVLHRAAMMVNPRNHLAANELAVLLARYGELEYAREVLLHSLAVAQLPEAWYNLSVIHQRLGQHDLAQRAKYEWQLASEQRNATSPNDPTAAIRWVDPRTFARTQSGGTSQQRMPNRPQPSPTPAKEAAKSWWRPWK